MSATVHDLLSRRARKHRPALHFETDVDALTFARAQVRELLDRTDGRLFLNAQDLNLPLSQLAAVLDACLRAHTRSRQESR